MLGACFVASPRPACRLILQPDARGIFIGKMQYLSKAYQYCTLKAQRVSLGKATANVPVFPRCPRYRLGHQPSHVDRRDRCDRRQAER